MSETSARWPVQLVILARYLVEVDGLQPTQLAPPLITSAFTMDPWLVTLSVAHSMNRSSNRSLAIICGDPRWYPAATLATLVHGRSRRWSISLSLTRSLGLCSLFVPVPFDEWRSREARARRHSLRHLFSFTTLQIRHSKCRLESAKSSRLLLMWSMSRRRSGGGPTPQCWQNSPPSR